jgi:molybdopterin molybdotransferase
MLTVPEASARILADIAPLPVEMVALRDALGRVAAADSVSPITLPAWANSAMDGYAVRGQDVERASEGAPVTLAVLETVAAGRFPTRPVGAGQATRIMTGAPLPDGSDTVVRVEDTDGGLERVAVRNNRDVRKNTRQAGEDMRIGDVVVAAGTPLGAAQIGVLSSIGLPSVPVYRRPRVAIIGSGDELVDVDRFDEVLAGRKIVSSNSYTLDALVRAAGGDPISLGVAEDTTAAVRERLERAVASGADLIVTSAGVSVGEFDYTREALAQLGTELTFWRVRMRPGAPVGFGSVRGLPWIGLPGNPVSVMVTFELFVRPVLRRMLGHSRLFRRPVPVVLDEPVSIGAKLLHFLRGVVSVAADGRLHARLTGAQGSGILTSMARANALLIVSEDPPRREAGETVQALLITDEAAMTERFEL